MKSLNPRITRLKELMELEERRAGLQAELDSLVDRMSALKDALFDDNAASSVGARAPAATTSAVARRGGRGGRTPRGELKSQLMSALNAAGSSGVRVTELARSLGLNPVNVHSWFHSASKRYPQIKKLDRGQYRLEGAIKSEAAPSSSPAAPKAGKRGGRRSTAPHSRRGELSKRILDELSGAGAKGITVRDLASKIGAPYKNIYIWFATTGKKNGKVKKIAPATYKLAA